MAARKTGTKRASTAKKTAGAAAGRGTAKTARKTAARGRRAAPEEDEGPPPAAGTTSLVIVESPAKAKTIGKYLGRGYRVRATVGHIMDLPEKKLGIDIDKGFEPELVPIPGKEKTIAELKSAAKDSREVFIATDPDREGEAIAWHVAEQIRPKRGVSTVPVRRVLFHEITKDAVQNAILQAGAIDDKKVEAQQARRVLDRLVGYKASPVLEKAGQRFTAKLHQIDGKKAEISNRSEADRVLSDLEGRKLFGVTEVKRRERRKNPSAPFTTSTLQQEAAKKLSFGSK